MKEVVVVLKYGLLVGPSGYINPHYHLLAPLLRAVRSRKGVRHV